GKGNRMFSPAMLIPVAAQGAVFIVAPDRYITALDAETGKELWRSNEVTVRESLGISNDNKLLYAKTMNDSIVAFRTNREKAELAWSLNLEYGYDHVPSMLIEKDGEVYFGGRNGVIFSVDPKDRKLNWSYKIDNSMVNTVNVLDKHSLTAATMDGKVVLLKWQ
ncbi:MAG: PQQ-binding-like beta-propeller repeat protein, partial [Salegentibacter sp.]